jgi:histone deacetylase 1/2
VRGDKQVAGVDYFESYAPVVSWTTVRLLMSLSLAFNLETRQTDFSNAFAQAYLKEEVYVELPQGFQPPPNSPEVVLQLVKSLYGLVQAPMCWYDHLKTALLKSGFKECSLDPCLFIHPDMIALVYVDDVLWFARDGTKIDAMLAKIRQAGLDLTVEGNVQAFLGIDFTRNDQDGTIKLTQRGLIERTIKAIGLDDCNPESTPATTEPVGSDRNGEPFDEPWSYASIVGMLMYLAANSRPEIAFAVHQCARFTHSPKKSHAKAVKRIVRYLKGTADDGMILRPSKELAVDCYADADFAGLWNHEDSQDPLCVKSRTGYVLMLADCPLVWVSKLQTEVAVSTMEAEYIALSQAMRELIPLRELVKEVSVALGKDAIVKGRTYSKVFEDNNGALTLATVPRMTPRSKHIAVKYHFFRTHVQKGDIKILKVDTTKQVADIMTKGLPKDTFQRLRKLLAGW